MRDIVRTLIALSDRVSALERSAGATARTPAPAAPSPAIVRLPGSAGVLPTAEEAEGAPPPTLPAPGVGETPPLWGRGIDWEQVLGMNWLAIIGAVALALGIGFFLKLAFDNNWIGPTGRVALGIGTGMALLGAGEYTKGRYPRWAQAATGGGVSILYLSVYAAYAFYGLLPAFPTLLLLGLVVVVAGVAALRYESLVIALMGIFGAFLTPVLLGQDVPDQRFLLVYILLVDAGVLGVSTFRHWRWFNLLGLLASYALFSLWVEQIPADWTLLAQAGLTGIFLIFVGATTLFHVLWKRVPNTTDMALMTLNAAAYFGATYSLLWADYQSWFGAFALALALFYGLVGLAATRRSGAPPQVTLFSWGTGLVFLTIAAPLQLTGSWITVAWAAEAVVLVWVGFVAGSWRARAFGLGVFAIAAYRLFVYDTLVDTETFRLFLNSRFPTFAISVAAAVVAAWLYRKNQYRLEEWEEYMAVTLAGAANLLALWVLSAEVVSYFDHQIVLAGEFQAAENSKLLTLTALWAVYALGLLGVALGTRWLAARLAGVGLLSLAALNLVLYDTWAVRLSPQSYILVFNVQFLTFILVLAVFCFAIYLYWRQREALEPWEGQVLAGVLVAANAVALWGLSAEVARFFNSQEVMAGRDMESAKHLGLTVLWAVYAIVIISVGIARGSSTVRLAGLALLALPVAKLFAFDVFLLERGYRVAAFVTLGVLLLGTGLVYQRYSVQVRRFLFGKAPPQEQA
ncbi:MAG: DUF2339 domain-containing protein [Chloroflexi bacterium]|nr:DUF2339 domain-containing protein [Chloroflexota bacterium]